MQTHQTTLATTAADVTYDKNGRMNYHPELHARQGKPWTTCEQAYLIAHYELIGPEQMSLALERTIHTIMTRAYELRKKGLMPRPERRVMHPRSGRGRSRAEKAFKHSAPALFVRPWQEAVAGELPNGFLGEAKVEIGSPPSGAASD